MPEQTIEGQLNATERRLLMQAIREAAVKPKVVIEVGTWFGGGSTLHILRALQQNGAGHLWGIEADRSVYEQMLTNLRAAAPEACSRFTPLFGFSQDVIPQWLAEQGRGVMVDFAFLDGSNNPGEQITEFHLLDSHIPVGGQLMAHDAKLRKGKWLVPYLSRLDNWRTELHDVSDEGLFHARKVAAQPSPASLRAAKARLLSLRCNPVEITAAILPSAICGFFLRLLPWHLARRLSDGRKRALPP
ncbi:MAG: class I SAM-dependent methyltransferase [Verrucomicrobia bacterium]|nr:class I SAM-dependent methyltransferase [Verrucomicrobiota bacterium]